MSSTADRSIDTCGELKKSIIKTCVENGRHMDTDDLQFTHLFNSTLVPGNWRDQPSKAWSDEEVLSLLVSRLRAINLDFERTRIQRGSRRGMGRRIIDTAIALVCDSEGPLAREHRRIRMRQRVERKMENEAKRREVWMKQAATGRGKRRGAACLLSPRRSQLVERRLRALCLTVMSAASAEKQTHRTCRGLEVQKSDGKRGSQVVPGWTSGCPQQTTRQ
ncbi:uncharacterized protein DNG_05545 [Cephalotrichum gorgonifer]|uniref:Uncharacterized protein n=1 Tax=Cephalotrichum gorgonifer TaxID=2041049 RepID=A0AAE8N023_9PEZI|nr:uncharacterized protein DNG_05545 [Cephalotrichum gorgonifer]